MKFEEVLPALREGKAIRRTNDFWKSFYFCYQLIDNQLWDGKENWVEEIGVSDLLADDWEEVEWYEIWRCDSSIKSGKEN